MMQHTPPGGVPGERPLSPMRTRSRTAREIALAEGAIPRNLLLPDLGREDSDTGGAAGGGETSAQPLINDGDFNTGYFSPEDILPIDQLRDMQINPGPPSHHSTGTVAETLTRLQIDMVRRNGEELNKMRQIMREEMQLAVREIQNQVREYFRAPQSVPPQETRPQVRLPSSQPTTRRRNGESGRTDQYPRSESFRHRESNLKIDKWGIKFDGDSSKMSVDDFIFRVEHLKAYHGASWPEVIGDFHKLLGQKASEWYWIQVRMNGVPDWNTLRAALRRTYSSRLTNFELERELMERTQKPGEGIDDYIHEMCRLRAQLRTPIDEAEMVRVLKRNVKESVGRILFPMSIVSVEKLRAEYHAIEKAFMKTNQVRSFQPTPVQRNYVRPQVHELAYDHEDEYWGTHVAPEVAELRGDHLTCWNCREIGHSYMACTRARTVFCYKCGKANVITPKCPNCKTGNQRRGPTTASASSSTQTEQ